ncbi:MAG: T9SS type A sorting domain-containing protein [Flavobacteriales bacterium]|nr:T9SS type A sorting domain-containing protein [Flavobacteriales bacterium]
MKKLFVLVLFAIFLYQAKAQVLVEATLLNTYTAAELNLVPGLTAEYDIEFYKIIYNTVDAHGNATIASGAYSRPVSDQCDFFPIAIYNHGTVLNKENVPSRDNAEAYICKFLGGLGYYSLAPDYIGMGDSPGLHPYIHAESEATSGIDLIRAMREFNETLGNSDNDELLITGYSQGGHAAMALHKYIEDNDLLSEFNVVASAPGSGPYNLSGSQTETILSGEPYSNPGYIVYALSSYELAYGDIYNTYSDVLQSPYDGIVVPFFNGNNTTLSMADLDPQLPAMVTDLLTPEYYQAFESDMNHPFRLALADNDNYDWAPERPIRMYYCTLDEQVQFTNSTDAETAMLANGATDVLAVELGPLGHGDCFLPAMLGAVNYFNSVRTECIVSSINDLNEVSFSLFPNPAAERIEIHSSELISYWEIFSSTGDLVMTSRRKKISSGLNNSIDLSSLSSGLYRLRVTDLNSKIGEKVFIKK